MLRRGAVVLAGLLLAAVAHAQDARAARPGDRLRLHLADLSIVEGMLVSATAESAFVRELTGTTRGVAIRAVTLAEVRMKGSRAAGAGRGAAMGVMAGLTLGAIVGVTAKDNCNDDQLCDSFSNVARMGAVLAGAVLGAGVGAVVGTAAPPDVWRPTELRAGATVALIR